MRSIIILIALITPAYILAQIQCPFYEEKVKQGYQYLKANDPAKAFEFFSNAQKEGRVCNLKSTIESEDGMKKAFDDLNKLKKNAEKSRELADTRLIKLSDLINNITDLIQDEKSDGILGFTPLKSDLLDVLIPASEFISSSSNNIEKPWRSAEIHFQKGSSFEDLSKSFESEKEFELAYIESYNVVKEFKHKNIIIQEELANIYLRALLFHTWNLITKNEIKKVTQIFLDAQYILPKIQIKTAKLNHAMAGFSNVQNRFYSDIIKNDSLALISVRNAVKYSRKAVEQDSSNIRYQISLATHLKNLSLDIKNQSKETIKELETEACQIYDKINSIPGNGEAAIDGVVGCVINESYNLCNIKMDSLAIQKLLFLTSKLEQLIYFNPSRKDNYLSRARVYIRIAQIQSWIKRDMEKTRFYTNLAVNDWINAIVSSTNIQNLWTVKGSYENISQLIDYCETRENIFSIHKRLLKALELNQKIYGNISEIIKITVLAYSKAAEFCPKKNREDTFLVLSYCNKSIEAVKKLNIEKAFSVYDEMYASYCKPFDDKNSLYISQENIEMARKSYKELHDFFDPIYKKYQFDFYLGQHFWGAAMRMGKFLSEKGYTSEAIPMLQYASYNGISESTKLLAKIYREDLKGQKNILFADSLENLAKKQSMKKFTIPCDFGDIKSPFDVYVRELPKDYPYKGIEDQSEWLLMAKGGKIPEEVRNSFIKLQELAWKRDVSFPNLCVQALEAANEEKKKTADSTTAILNTKLINKNTNNNIAFEKNKNSIKYLIKTNDIEKLKLYLDFYLNENNLINAMAVKKKILKLNDDAQTKYYILNTYLKYNLEENFDLLFLTNPKKIKEYRDYFLSKKVDSLPNENLKRVFYANLVLLDSKYLELLPKDSLLAIKYLSQHYNSLGWQCLLTERFENTIFYFKKSIELNENNLYAYGNLPHAYLFTGQIQKAKELYVKLKDLAFDKEAGYPTFKDAFLSDFKDFEKAGLMNDYIKEIIRLLNE